MTRRRYTDDQLREAVAASRTMREVCTALGLVPRGGNYETVRREIARLGLDAEHLRVRPSALRPDDTVRAAAARSPDLSALLAELELRPTVVHRRRLRRQLAHLGIALVDDLGDEPTPRARAPLSELLVAGRLVSTAKLRRRLVEEGVFAAACAMCGRDRWAAQPIPLELDHINGDRWDNRLRNLRLLCPNCHATTPTYRGRNVGRTVQQSGPRSPTGERQGS